MYNLLFGGIVEPSHGMVENHEFRSNFHLDRVKGLKYHEYPRFQFSIKLLWVIQSYCVHIFFDLFFTLKSKEFEINLICLRK